MNTETNPNTHSNDSTPSLRYFTQPASLQQIGPRRLAKFFNGFNGELPPNLVQLVSTLDGQSPAGVPLAELVFDPLHALDPDTLHALAAPQQSDGGPRSTPFTALAAILGCSSRLPERPRVALFALEASAAPENQARLDDAISRPVEERDQPGRTPLGSLTHRPRCLGWHGQEQR